MKPGNQKMVESNGFRGSSVAYLADSNKDSLVAGSEF